MKSFFLILTFVFGSTAEVTALDLQPIPESQIEYGCGCGYLTKPPMPVGPVVQTGLSFEEPRAFIAGRLVPLDPVEVEPLPATPEVGGVFTQHYRYRDADFYFVNTITFVCPRDPDGVAR